MVLELAQAVVCPAVECIDDHLETLSLRSFSKHWAILESLAKGTTNVKTESLIVAKHSEEEVAGCQGVLGTVYLSAY